MNPEFLQNLPGKSGKTSHVGPHIPRAKFDPTSGVFLFDSCSASSLCASSSAAKEEEAHRKFHFVLEFRTCCLAHISPCPITRPFPPWIVPVTPELGPHSSDPSRPVEIPAEKWPFRGRKQHRKSGVSRVSHLIFFSSSSFILVAFFGLVAVIAPGSFPRPVLVRWMDGRTPS